MLFPRATKLKTALQAVLNTTGGEIVITGSNFGGNPIVVEGASNFSDYNRTVTIGDAPCVVSAWNHTSITCVAGPGFLQRQDVIVEAQGLSSGSSGALFGYLPPEIVSITPNHALSSGGSSITVIGFNFGEPSVPLSVLFVRNALISYNCNVTVRTQFCFGCLFWRIGQGLLVYSALFTESQPHGCTVHRQ
jgi:hypothetical protein